MSAQNNYSARKNIEKNIDMLRTMCGLFSALALELLLLFASALPSFAGGELRITPAMPQPGGRAEFVYMPDSIWRNESVLYVFVYRFREMTGEPIADYAALRKSVDASGKTLWRGEIAVDSSDVFWMMKVYNGKRADDNDGAYWEAFISSDGEKPVQGAKLRAGIAYLGALPETCSRSADFQKALAHLREELQLYPNNLSAKIAEISLAYELKVIKSDIHQLQMTRILQMPLDTSRENDTRSVIRALNALGRSYEANSLQQQFIAKYPRSGIAEEYMMWQLQNTSNPQFFVDKIREYHEKFPASPNLPTLQANAIPAMKEMNKLHTAGRWLDSLPVPPSAMAFNELAKFLIRYDTLAREDAARYAERAVELARQNRIFVRPPHITSVEWNANTAATVGDMYNTLATAYFELQRNDDALSTFYKALHATQGELPSQAYSQAAMLHVLKKQFSEALRIASQGTVINAGGDDVLMRWHKAAMDSVMGGKADSLYYARERARLLDSATVLNVYRQYLQRLDRPLIAGRYFDVSKKSYQIDDLKGKVTLLVFWSSWAEPCQKMMPYLNVLYKKYANSGTVNFVVIDTWEDRSSDRFRIVRDYMNKNKSLYFPIFIDDSDILAQKYGVMGVPMRLYIDKLGRIQYKATGFSDSAKLIQEIEETLTLLLSDQFYYFQ